VLHGGGNTSVKLRQPNLFGDEEDVLFVKASGSDLATIDEGGFTAVRLERLRALTQLEQMDDPTLATELRLSMLDPEARPPSVEAILHAVVPATYDHTHSEALLALANTPSGEDHVRRAFGDRVVVVPYARPGFALGRVCAQHVDELADSTIGLVLLRHGLVSFGSTAQESYDRMIELVTCAEAYLAANGVEPSPAPSSADVGEPVDGLDVARLRRDLSAFAGTPMVMCHDRDVRTLMFARREDVADLSQVGPATPDHVILTKRVPLIGRDVARYADSYREYFDEHAQPGLEMLDPAPRIVLDPELGLCAAGRNAAEADAAAEVYKRTIDVILRATALERWDALSAGDVFAVEYWPLEQAKLHRTKGEFEGEVAVVTGAASGIGAACVNALLARGAAVCGLDIDKRVTALSRTSAFLGIECDISREDEVRWAFETFAHRFGGVDMLLLSAGVFPASERIDSLDLSDWRRTFAINTDADLSLLRIAHPFLQLAPNGGRVVVIASKNVPAPGPGAAAYSASKAALTQLARVAALEWGADGIRVNVIHPNAVFDTAIWSDDVIRARAEQYGLTPEEYRTLNVLKVEITSPDVAELAVAMCGRAFAKTTGAQVPVDGGNERVI
jgi:rhamnose utilization protein RhaD (predicted bifunctional aldolase and dehydrogenase)/NAD(P)-dependent dehydrogenase (short-subunit alcohol dehydrogenase family)